MWNGLISHCCQRAHGYSVKQLQSIYTAGGSTQALSQSWRYAVTLYAPTLDASFRGCMMGVGGRGWASCARHVFQSAWIWRVKMEKTKVGNEDPIPSSFILILARFNSHRLPPPLSLLPAACISFHTHREPSGYAPFPSCSIHWCPRAHRDWFDPFCVTLKGLKGNMEPFSIIILPACLQPSGAPAFYVSNVLPLSRDKLLPGSRSYSWPRASQSISSWEHFT